MQDTQDRGLGAYYQVWLQQAQYNKYIRYSGWSQLMMVVWYVSPYRIGTLPGYVQNYGSNSKSVGKAQGIGLVTKVPTMDQTQKMADSHTLSMLIMARLFHLRQGKLLILFWF